MFMTLEQADAAQASYLSFRGVLMEFNRLSTGPYEYSPTDIITLILHRNMVRAN